MALEVVVRDDLDSAASEAAERVVAGAKSALAARSRFALALDGGRATQRLCERLAAAPGEVDWGRTAVLMVDERQVPDGDNRSNRGLLERLLIAPLPTKPRWVALHGEAANPQAEAARFSGAWRSELGQTGADLLFLGLGPDGHIASLFPGTAGLEEAERVALAVDAPTIAEPHVARLTLSPKTLLASRAVVLFAIGEEKREALARVLAPNGATAETPARLLLQHPHLAVIADPAAVGHRERP